MRAPDTGQLWAGDFGCEYIQRNSNLPDRSQFWSRIAKRYRPGTLLEVGCNIGHNLRFLKKALPRSRLYGCDVNEEALAILRAQQPGILTDRGDIRDLPYDDGAFDMVVCVGVLIHVTNDAELKRAVEEMARVSRRYILVAEYWAPRWEMIPYHGYDNALRKGPFDKVLTDAGVWLEDSGRLEQKDGFDRLHYWVISV